MIASSSFESRFEAAGKLGSEMTPVSHQGRRGKKMLGALGDCKITITVIKYGV